MTMQLTDAVSFALLVLAHFDTSGVKRRKIAGCVGCFGFSMAAVYVTSLAWICFLNCFLYHIMLPHQPWARAWDVMCNLAMIVMMITSIPAPCALVVCCVCCSWVLREEFVFSCYKASSGGGIATVLTNLKSDHWIKPNWHDRDEILHVLQTTVPCIAMMFMSQKSPKFQMPLSSVFNLNVTAV